MSNEVEHLFKYLFAICMSSLIKYPLKSLAIFLLHGLVAYYWVIFSIIKFWDFFTLNKRLLFLIWFENISFQSSVACPFILLAESFKEQSAQTLSSLFVRFTSILTHFISLDALVNGIVYLILISDCPLPIYRNSITVIFAYWLCISFIFSTDWICPDLRGSPLSGL